MVSGLERFRGFSVSGFYGLRFRVPWFRVQGSKFYGLGFKV